MVLAQKQTHRSKEQNREPRNKPILTWSINLWQRRQEYTMGERQSLWQIMLGKLDSYMQKNQTGPLSHAIYKNKFKKIKDLNVKTWNYKTPKRKYRQHASVSAIFFFFWCVSSGRENKNKINKWDYIKLRGFAQQGKLSAK